MPEVLNDESLMLWLLRFELPSMIIRAIVSSNKERTVTIYKRIIPLQTLYW